jgi:prepilin-type N-terminal cleavage/methylation domain-containing protein
LSTTSCITPKAASSRRRIERRGVSLVEILIAIGIIGLLIGILVPMLGRARGQTLEVVSLSNAREVVKTMHAHASANSDRFPFPPREEREDPGVWFGPIIWTPDGELTDATGTHFYGNESYIFMSEYWPAFVRDVAPWTEHYQTWLSPGHPALADKNDTRPLWARGSSINAVSYHYSLAFMVSPRLLEENAPTDWSLIQPTRSSMVAYPASKVIAFDADRSYLARGKGDSSKWPTGFTDGSASLRDRSQAMTIRNPLAGGGPYHDTPGGVTGRDF